MTVCPNCNHHNPDEASHCEACFTPLPKEIRCPSCDAMVQSDASFCGQCGFRLQDVSPDSLSPLPPTVAVAASSAPPTVPLHPTEKTVQSSSSGSTAPLPAPFASPPTIPATEVERGQSPLPPTVASPELSSDIPELPPLEPIVQPDPLAAELEMSSNSETNPSSPVPPQETRGVDTSHPSVPEESGASLPPAPVPSSPPTVAQIPVRSVSSQTVLQTQVARLLHVQTNTPVELPANLSVIHIGKPNDRVPPDVDVSGFPNSEIVSRVHADIRIEADSHYIEDVGSANGTYINNLPLPQGNRHRLRPGDRIALGKGDKVTFLFQLS